jgi:hypothetical protein
MDLQALITLIGKALPLILDLAGFVPVIGTFSSAIRLAEDGIAVEESAFAFLQSPEGAKARALVARLAHDMGFHPNFTEGAIKLESRDNVQADLDSGVL